MKIKSFAVSNFKGWADSDNIGLATKMNILVGQNNAGKSSLLEAIGLVGGHRPYRSEATAASPQSIISAPSKTNLVLEFSPNELMQMVSLISTQFTIPAPPPTDPNDPLSVFNSQILAHQWIEMSFLNSSIAEITTEKDYGAIKSGYMCVIDGPARHLRQISGYSGLNSPGELFYYKIIDQIKSRLYFFHAERYNVAQSIVSNNQVLSSKSENLAQVLNHLISSDKLKFEEYVRYVNKVLPQVKDIIVPPVANSNAQIKIWTVKPKIGRSDLAIPLSECGTGVGQVLAMLYVIIFSEHSQCILIDEPQSFLHPGAIRSLMDIFEKFDRHQYVIATHAASLLKSDAQILRVKSDGITSACEIISSGSAKEVRSILDEIGASLSDVYGADKILWVEGATEVRCFRLIIQHFGLASVWTLEIVGVMSTGDLEGRDAERIYDIYQRLSSSTALIPPAVAFIFDRETRTDKLLEDLKRKSSNRVVFLKRRMFENYLLDSAAITIVLNSTNLFSPPIQNKDVEKWIAANRTMPEYFNTEVKIDSDAWVSDINGGKFLKKLFSSISQNTLQYDKVRHGYDLTLEILNNSPEDLIDLRDLLHDVLMHKG